MSFYPAEDAPFPYFTMTPIAVAEVPTPATGTLAHFIDSADGLHKSMDDERTVTVIGATAPVGIGGTFAGAQAGDTFARRMAFGGTITGWYAASHDGAGGAEVDVRVVSHADWPADATDSITDGNPIELTAEATASDTTLTGWTVAFSAGDWIVFVLVDITGIDVLEVNLDAVKGS